MTAPSPPKYSQRWERSERGRSTANAAGHTVHPHPEPPPTLKQPQKPHREGKTPPLVGKVAPAGMAALVG